MKAKLTIVDSVAQKQEDIFTVGNLVIAPDSGEIVLIVGSYNKPDSDDLFSGVRLSGGSLYHSVNWYKGSFVQYYGTVSLSTVNSTEE